jgi:aminocarboxymuconate-semialdehyde decarboxylase
MGVARPLDLPHEVGLDDAALERNALRFLGL